VGAGLFVAALCLYLATLAPTVTLVDSGELASACYLLDIAHPPGMPLYVLIGWGASRLPWGSVAQRLNLLSAVFAALSVTVVFCLGCLAVGLTERQPIETGRRGTIETRRDRPGEAWLAMAAPAVAALTYAASGTLWAYATVTEVYTLSTLLIAGSIAAWWVWLRKAQTAPGGDFRWCATGLGLALGLALSVHHVSVAFVLAGVLLTAVKHRKVVFKKAPAVRFAVGLGVGLLPYLYLPIRARQAPPLNWGDPGSWERFVWHVTGKQYQSNLFSTDVAAVGRRLVFFLELGVSELTFLGLALVLAGAWAVWKRNRTLFAACSAVAAANLAYALVYDISEDNEAYALPAFVLFGVLLACGLHRLLCLVSTRRRLWVSLTSAALLLPVWTIHTHFARNDHRQHFVARDYALSVLDNVSPGGLLLTMDWQLYSPLLYFQQVEALRPDVTVIDINLVRRSWYLRRLQRRFPALLNAVQAPLDQYSSQLDLFEQGKPYDPAAIQAAFVRLGNSFIEASLSNHPVYLTLEMDAEREIGRGWFKVPRGMVFQLFASRPPPQPAGLFHTDSLLDRRVHLDDVMLRVKKSFALMMVNRGIYVTLDQRHEEAIRWYRQALRLDGDVPVGYWMLGRSCAALGRFDEAREAYLQGLRLAPGELAMRQELERLEAAGER
jgi:tetratricopeptide (TPR) repeat protein